MSVPAISLWTILELAFFGPTQNDFAHRGYWEIALMRDLLSPKGMNKYDRTIPTLKPPINVTPIIQIEHLEPLEEKHQVMSLTGSLLLKWKDSRLKWNISEYGDIHMFAKPRNYLRNSNLEPFIPKIFATELFSRSADLLQQDHAQVNVASTGVVSVAIKDEADDTKVKFNIRTTCHFSFDNFPNDQENCSVTFYTNSPLSQVSLNVYKYSSPEPKRSGTNKPIYVGSWQFIGIDSESIYLYGSKPIKDPRKYDLSYVRSIGYYNLRFMRKYVFYNVKMGHPTFGVSFLVLCIFLYNSYDAIYSALILYVAEMLIFKNMKEDLPIDYDTMPNVAFIMMVTMLETFLVLIWKFALFYTQQEKEYHQINQNLRLVHHYLRYFVPFHLIYNYYMIYY